MSDDVKFVIVKFVKFMIVYWTISGIVLLAALLGQVTGELILWILKCP